MRRAALMIAFVVPACCWAQTGVQDQVSPHDPFSPSGAWYNENESFLVWQQQIRAGVSGQLEGVVLTLATSPAGANFNVRIRLGAGPSFNPIVFQTLVTNDTGSFETKFVDMASANIMLSAGDDFVMETQGTNTGAGLIGNYISPQSGPPLYPHPLFLNNGDFPPGWRHGFESYMLVQGGCEPCDTNCDGSINAFDIQPFVEVLSGGRPCSECAGDANNDGSLNGFDIQGFVDCLAG